MLRALCNQIVEKTCIVPNLLYINKLAFFSIVDFFVGGQTEINETINRKVNFEEKPK